MSQAMSEGSGGSVAGVATPEPVARVALTAKAVALLSELTQVHGP